MSVKVVYTNIQIATLGIHKSLIVKVYPAMFIVLYFIHYSVFHMYDTCNLFQMFLLGKKLYIIYNIWVTIINIYEVYRGMIQTTHCIYNKNFN